MTIQSLITDSVLTVVYSVGAFAALVAGAVSAPIDTLQGADREDVYPWILLWIGIFVLILALRSSPGSDKLGWRRTTIFWTNPGQSCADACGPKLQCDATLVEQATTADNRNWLAAEQFVAHYPSLAAFCGDINMEPPPAEGEYWLEEDTFTNLSIEGDTCVITLLPLLNGSCKFSDPDKRVACHCL